MEVLAKAGADMVDRAKAGDKDAYEALLRPALPAALRLARVLLGDPGEAEDAVQEAAIKGWRKLRNLREQTDFAPWFLGIVVRQARTSQRRRWWRVIRMPEVRSRISDDFEGGWLAGEDLRRAVARALGLTPAAIKSRLNRAFRQLRAEH